MLWLYVVAAGTGALLGLLWLRAPAIPALVILVVLMAFRHWPLLEAIINAYLLVVTFQLSYLVGVYATQLSGTRSVQGPISRHRLKHFRRSQIPREEIQVMSLRAARSDVDKIGFSIVRRRQ
jgi:hypothetical protein